MKKFKKFVKNDRKILDNDGIPCIYIDHGSHSQPFAGVRARLNNNVLESASVVLEHAGYNQMPANEIDDAFKSGDSYKIHKALGSVHATPEHIDKGLDNESDYVREHAITHDNASHENLMKAMGDTSSKVRLAALVHKNITTEHLSKAVVDKSEYVREKAAVHPKLTDEHVDHLVNDPSEFVRESIASHPNLKQHHIEKLLSDKSSYVRNIAAKHPGVTSESISKIMETGSSTSKKAVLEHPNATEEHISKGLADPDYRIRMAAISNPKVTSEHLSKALEDKEADVVHKALQNQNISDKHISKVLDNPSNDFTTEKIKVAAVSHPNATEEHLSKALATIKNGAIKGDLLNHPKINDTHINNALKTADFQTKFKLIHHKKVKGDTLSKLIDEGNTDLKNSAVYNPNLEKHHMLKILDDKNTTNTHYFFDYNKSKVDSQVIDKALDNKDEYTQIKALQHPAVTPENIEKALKSKSTDVIQTALKSSAATEEQLKAHTTHPDEEIRKAAQHGLFYRHDNTHIGKLVSDVDKHLKDMQEKAPVKPDDLPYKQLSAIKEYTDSSRDLNKHLHATGGDDSKIDPYYRERVQNTDDAIASQKVPKMKVYAGIKFHPNLSIKDGLFRSPAYLSTTINPPVTEKFTRPHFNPESGEDEKHVLRIHLPEGQHGFYTGNGSEGSRHTIHDENEVLLPRNMRFKISDKPTRQTTDYDGLKLHMWDAHPIPHGVDAATWEPPKEK